jgi:hypothetical protein
MRTTDVDRALHRLAAGQMWLFARAQAARLGATDRYLAKRKAEGYLIHPEQSVYGFPGHPMTWKRRLKACELGARGSAIGGLAAAALHGLTDFRPCKPELVVPPSTSSRGKTARIHRQVGYKTTEVDGLKVTTIAQTLFDIAPDVGLWRLERAMDDAIVSRRLTVDDLEERSRFYEGTRRRGLPRMRALIAERRAEGWAPPESELEVLLYAMLARVPDLRVERQPSWPWRQTAQGRVDSYLPDHEVICEGDSRRWHARVADFDRDRWRDNQATAHGLRVLRFTWTHLTMFGDECVKIVEQSTTNREAA